MPRKVLLFAALTVLANIYAQGQSSTQPTATVGPFGGPILTTPTATLPTPAPVAGISDAGRAGISNAENNSGNVAPSVLVPPATTISSPEAIATPQGAAVPNATTPEPVASATSNSETLAPATSAIPLEGQHALD